MNLTKLRLQNFRNYETSEFDFSNQTTLIVGQNAIGKSNLLEAVYLLATGKSFRANLEQEMINWSREIGRVKGRVIDGEDRIDLEIVLTRGQIEGQKTARKKFTVNGVARRMSDYAGILKTVYFGPEDLTLVTGSPSVRRRYLDNVLSQVDREYGRSILSYEKGLRQRNKLLEQIREGEASRTQLAFWDQLLIKNGELVTQKREEYLEFINQYFNADEERVSPDFAYLGNFILTYDRSVISQARLAEYASEEVSAGATLVGPHRDDFSFEEKNGRLTEVRDLATYGSRGEQRLTVLWLKLCELEYIAQKSGKRPLLLLDDVFSELDHDHRRLVLEVIPHQQTIITAADIHLVEREYQGKMEIIKL